MDWREAHRKLLQDKETRQAYEKVDLGFEIGKMITDARIAKNMTQQKLAQLVGTRQPSIARLEKGNSLPSLSFLQKIAKAFNTQLLPPRLEFLERQKRTVTVVVPAAVMFTRRPGPDLGSWSLRPGLKYRNWQDLEVNADKGVQYAIS